MHGAHPGTARNPPSSSSPPANARIHPHDLPRQVAANLWQVRGSLSVPLVPRYMTIHRLSDGRLILYSAIAMHEDGMAALEALGTPSILIVPHDRHQMDAPFYKQRYPNLRVLAPEPSHARNVPIDGDVSELDALGIRAYPLPGTSYREVILEIPIHDGVALCACELLGHFEHAHGVLGMFTRIFGPPNGEFGVNRAVRWREVIDRQKVKDWLASLAGRTDIRLVVLAHGTPLTADVPAALRRAAAEA
jgi:hypothetical protein